MLSDVLFEALDSLDHYLTRFPETYRPFASQIGLWRAATQGLLSILDVPPPTGETIAPEPDQAVDGERAPLKVGKCPGCHHAFPLVRSGERLLLSAHWACKIAGQVRCPGGGCEPL